MLGYVLTVLPWWVGGVCAQCSHGG